MTEEARIYEDTLQSLNTPEELIKFLNYSAKMSHFTLRNKILLYHNLPEATLCASYDQWNSIGRYVNKGAKGIKLFLRNGNNFDKAYIYDISQTHGEEEPIALMRIENPISIIKGLRENYGLESTDGNVLINAVDTLNRAYIEVNRKSFKDLTNVLEIANKIAEYCVSRRFSDISNEIPNHYLTTLIQDKDLLTMVLYVASNSVKDVIKNINSLAKEGIEHERNGSNDEGRVSNNSRNYSERSQTQSVGQTSTQIHGRTEGNAVGRNVTRRNIGELSLGTTGDSVGQVLDVYGTTRTSQPTEQRVNSVTSDTIQASNSESSKRNGTRRTSQLIILDDEEISERADKKDAALLSMQENNSKNYHFEEEFKYSEGLKAKYKDNIEAIKTLKIIETEERNATIEEQHILARYTGWGGMPQVFNSNSEWKNEYYELKELLNSEEYMAAKGSVVNSFYTNPTIIKVMYQAIEEMGLISGKVLEPSVGTGNFIGMIPKHLNYQVTGIELDDLTGRIAKNLYPGENLHIKGFEKVLLADDTFDLAIGNVPFGNYRLYEQRYADNNFLIHDHFFAKALDKVRPEGVIAFITSKGTLDKKDSSIRQYLCERAELLGAIRLPNNAFKSNANTEVTTDIIFFKKRKERIEAAHEDWVDVAADSKGIVINKYFINHPDMMLGEMVETSGAYGPEYTLRPNNDQTLSEGLNQVISKLPKNIYGVQSKVKQESMKKTEGEVEEALDVNNYKNGELILVGDKIYQRVDEKIECLLLSEDVFNRTKGLIQVKSALREVLDSQLNGCTDAELQGLQDNLTMVYDQFVRKYGYINITKNKKAFADDPDYLLVASLEDVNQETKQAKKARIFTERTIKITPEITHVDTANEALTVSLNQKGRVDIEYMANLTDLQPQQVIEELRGIIYKNPNKNIENDEVGYETADEYLSGNVREKLKIAQEAAKENPNFIINVEKLKEVQPIDLQPSEIDVRLGATWVPKEDIKQFILETFKPPSYAKNNIGVSYISVIAEWKVEGKAKYGDVTSTKTYGTSRVDAYELLEQALNLKTPTIYDVLQDERRVVNQKETTAAREKQEQIKNKFKQWIFEDPDRRERLVKKYNEEYNSTVIRTYDGSHLSFQGMAYNIELRPHQKNGVAHILYGETGTLLAHCVGAGKTWTMTAGAMELKRLGLANKILMVVPNHLTEQWGKEWLQAYPSANILVATKKDFIKENRKKFASKIATGNYDAIIIGHSSFGKIDVTNETKERHIRKEIEAIEQAIIQLTSEDKRNSTRLVKRLETTKKNLEANLQEQLDMKKDDVIYFEELGIDKIFIDEAHEFKNLYLHTKMNNVAGVPQTKSKKAADLYMKISYLNDTLHTNNNVVFATGTPISNSMAEMFTVQRYLQGELLNELGMGHFDAWAANFGEAVSSFEVAPDGSGFRAKTRFSKFVNLPELMSLYRRSADIQTPEMLNLPTPKLKNGKPTIVKVEASEELKDFIQNNLMERSQIIKDRLVDPSQDNMLKVTTDGRKVAVDMRLYDEAYGDFENSKINKAVENIYNIWESTKEKKSAQLVFCDLSTPNKDKFNVYDEIKSKLILLGVKEDEIKFIHDANTDEQKDKLFQSVRNGKVRILLGSTAKMGAGTNVQNKLVALHHIDVPWRPSDIEQREGRILRQGNENKEVEIFRYVTEGSFDSYSWQTIETKQKFISQVMSGDTTIRNIEDMDEASLNYAEIKAIATGNPLILKKMEVDTEVVRLKVLESQYVNQKYYLQDSINKHLPKEIAYQESILSKLKIDVANVQLPQEPDEFKIVINNIEFNKRVEAGEYIINECYAKMEPNQTLNDAGRFAGISFDIYKDYMKQGHVILKGTLQYETDITTSIGTITRIESKLAGLPERIQKTIISLDETKRQLELAKEEVEKPFEHKDKLANLLKEQATINAQLDLEVKDSRDKEGTIDKDKVNGDTRWHIGIDCLERELEKEEKKDFNRWLKPNTEKSNTGFNRKKERLNAQTNIKRSSQVERS